MNELTDRLKNRFNELADTAQARRDIGGVIEGTESGRQSRTRERPKDLPVAQIAAGLIVVAGVGALVAFGAVRGPSTATEPAASELPLATQPADPMTQEAELTVHECLAVAVQKAQTEDLPNATGDHAERPGASADRNVADWRACEEALVAGGMSDLQADGSVQADTQDGDEAEPKRFTFDDQNGEISVTDIIDRDGGVVSIQLTANSFPGVTLYVHIVPGQYAAPLADLNPEPIEILGNAGVNVRWPDGSQSLIWQDSADLAIELSATPAVDGTAMPPTAQLVGIAQRLVEVDESEWISYRNRHSE